VTVSGRAGVPPQTGHAGSECRPEISRPTPAAATGENRAPARAALAANETAVARSALDRAALLTSTNSSVLQLNFKYYWQTTNYPAARDAMQQLIRVMPGPENEYWLRETEKRMTRAGPPATAEPPGKSP